GMKQSQCNATSRSLKASDGSLWIPTITGLIRVDPKRILNNQIKPPVYIEKLIIDNDAVDLSHNITVRPGKHRFTFSYTALSYIYPKKVQFKYQLEGFDENWIKAGNFRSVSYTNLDKGNYIFRVIACNNDGLWNAEGDSLAFTVLPYFFQKAIFYIPAILIVLLILIIAYKIRVRQLRRQKSELEKIVNLRTKEVKIQNKELEKQKEQIMTHVENLEEANRLILEKNTLLEKQKIEITDSIHYAKRIQKAMFPSLETITSYFPEHFIFFKPKDIVSGDFYWVKKVNNSVLFAAADCTGHGVPGAFMSMLGIALLNEITRKKDITRPDIALEELRIQIKNCLHQISASNKKEFNNKLFMSDEVQDGMDIALCAYELNTKELEYAGANQPLYIIRNNKLIEIKATENPIGAYLREEPFAYHKVQLLPNDTIYLFTDGYIDQFGGKDKNKFYIKQFNEILLEINQKPLKLQSEILESTMHEWKNGVEQVDDMLIIGIRID
ncbi:MAG: SpoIIE family protein phosphatase, partial [Bacteroidota bacterium]